MSHASAETRNKSTSAQASTHREDSGKLANPAKNKGDGVDREEMISVAAYYLAEHRGFDGGDPMADWLAAEEQIEAELNNPDEIVVH